MTAPVLITGATGFVGAAVARQLAARGTPLRLLVRAGADRRNLAGLAAEIITGDLLDENSLRTAVAGCAGLFHVAADYRLWVPDAAAMFRANVDGTQALMRAALKAGVPRIVYTSSVATLGCYKDGRVADESTPSVYADMIGPYKQSKFLAEEAVRQLAAQDGLPVVIVNPAAPIGPGDIKPTPTGKMIRDAGAGALPAYVDTGLNIVHVDDVAAGHLLAYEKGRAGERYILGGENLRLSELLTLIAEAAGHAPPKIRLPIGPLRPIAFVMEVIARLGGPQPLMCRDSLKMAEKMMFFSSAKAEAALGYRARPAAAAVRDALAWFGLLPGTQAA